MFCQNCIAGTSHCPGCRSYLTPPQLIDSPLVVRAALESIAIVCLRCFQRLSRGKWTEHERACPAVVDVIMEAEQEQSRKNERRMLLVSTMHGPEDQMSCPALSLGCTFTSVPDGMATHVEICPYLDVQDQLRALTSALEQKKETRDELMESVRVAEEHAANVRIAFDNAGSRLAPSGTSGALTPRGGERPLTFGAAVGSARWLSRFEQYLRLFHQSHYLSAFDAMTVYKGSPSIPAATNIFVTFFAPELKPEVRVMLSRPTLDEITAAIDRRKPKVTPNLFDNAFSEVERFLSMRYENWCGTESHVAGSPTPPRRKRDISLPNFSHLR